MRLKRPYDMGLQLADPEWPTFDPRNAINAGFVAGPRLIVAAHIITANAGHGNLQTFTFLGGICRFRPPLTILEALEP